MKDFNITEDELVRIFKRRKGHSSAPAKMLELLSLLVIAGATFIILYVLINFSAISLKTVFWYKNNVQATPTPATTQDKVIISDITPDSIKQDALPDIADNHIKISAINVDAPISWQVANAPKSVSASLENGLIQIAGTSLPGEIGNSYITGHSSNYIWAKGSYNSVLALLDNLVDGDLIYLKYNGTTYAYKVAEKRVVQANDGTIISQTTDSRLTIVTCWPVGTSLKRLAVSAEQIYPDPSKNIPHSGPSLTQTEKLPSGR